MNESKTNSTITGADSETSKPYPKPWVAWSMVLLLMLAYVFSFVDRYIIGYLIEPIKADLGITDEQFGLITGLAFAVFYATMGIPLGWLIDRRRRTWILAGGIAVWSIATAASGLARNFWQLFIARMGIGAGEATLSPAAFSIIGDAFPPEKRGKPIAIYTMALVVGASAASFIAGIALTLTKQATNYDLPFIGSVAPWQMTFFAVGLPGLLLSGVFFFLREPERRLVSADAAGLKGNNFSDTLEFLGRNWGTYLGFVSLICVMTIIAYGQGNFLPAAFERSYGWAGEKYAFVNGTAFLFIGPLTYLVTGYMADRWSQKGLVDGPFRLLIIGYLIMVPTGVLFMLMPTGETAYAVAAMNNVGIGMVSAVGVTALLMITPAQIRGQVVALYYMAISMSGLLLGPMTVGSLSTRVFGEENLRFAIAALPAIYGLIPLLLIPVVRKLYLAQVSKLQVVETK